MNLDIFTLANASQAISAPEGWTGHDGVETTPAWT